jgi:hypothetical protein
MNKLNEAKKMADKVINGNPFPIGSLGYRIAKAELTVNGFYGYRNSETNERILIVPDLIVENMSTCDYPAPVIEESPIPFIVL